MHHINNRVGPPRKRVTKRILQLEARLRARLRKQKGALVREANTTEEVKHSLDTSTEGLQTLRRCLQALKERVSDGNEKLRLVESKCQAEKKVYEKRLVKSMRKQQMRREDKKLAAVREAQQGAGDLEKLREVAEQRRSELKGQLRVVELQARHALASNQRALRQELLDLEESQQRNFNRYREREEAGFTFATHAPETRNKTLIDGIVQRQEELLSDERGRHQVSASEGVAIIERLQGQKQRLLAAVDDQEERRRRVLESFSATMRTARAVELRIEQLEGQLDEYKSARRLCKRLAKTECSLDKSIISLLQQNKRCLFDSADVGAQASALQIVLNRVALFLRAERQQLEAEVRALAWPAAGRGPSRSQSEPVGSDSATAAANN